MSYNRYKLDGIRALTEEVFKQYDYTPEEAAFIADVILTADLFGIESHGVNRLALYTTGIEIGRIKLGVKPQIIHETPISATIDACDGEGHLAARAGMNLAIEKAQMNGVGIVTVRNSNHFGIGGYYSRMALPHGLFGVALTNAEAMVVPTFGKRPMLGTNPIAVSMPGHPIPFNLDMATSVVPAGKVEVYAKNNKPIPLGWIVDPEGGNDDDAQTFIHIRNNKTDGGMLPLGGRGEEHSGHKGYGLALLVELMTAGFSCGNTGDRVRAVKNMERCCHCFMAIDYSIFGDKNDIEAGFSEYLDRLRQSPKAAGESRIYIHGEKEQENVKRVRREGVAINEPTMEEIRKLSAMKNIDYKKYLIGV